MKRVDTMIIEKLLLSSCFSQNPKLAKEYGTTEVTIDFQRNGGGRQIVDFMSHDPKENIFRCYEIKVTMQDFKSDAKKSWCGNYNYLVLSEDLFKKESIDFWRKQIPIHVGIIVANPEAFTKKCVKPARFISSADKDMLKNSLIRTLFYQNTNPDWYLRR